MKRILALAAVLSCVACASQTPAQQAATIQTLCLIDGIVQPLTVAIGTAATGAILAPGAIAGTPATIMAGGVTQTQNWVTFMTVWEPDLTTKEAFAAWVQTINLMNNR